MGSEGTQMSPEERERILRQNEIFSKHVLERIELSVRQAQEWADYFRSQGDLENLRKWENTTKFRLKTFVAHTQNDLPDREYRIENDF